MAGRLAEHVHGGEAGLRYVRGRVMLSGTFFQENVDDPVGNITQSSTATLITRQRQNIGALRAASRQFDDDLNQFELQPYSVLGLSVSKQTGLLTWFAGAANIFDSKVQTAATPVLNYASPRILSGGVRVVVGR